MHRVFSRLVPFIACCLIMISCGDDQNPVAPPPVDPSVISTFTGTLSLNGAVTHNFTVTGMFVTAFFIASAMRRMRCG